jgi:membrane fusion protein, heavy metal efflux system
MQRQNIAIIAIAAITLVLGGVILSLDPAPVAQEHGDEHDHDHGEGGGMPSHVEITPEAAIAAGAKLATAGPGMVAQSLMTSGTVVFDSAGMARARARFPGIVREVRKNVGDKASTGETLAMVESNDSLQSYAVKAPIDGVIIARNTNLGEIADDSPLFVIANPSRVWAEVHIFSKDLSTVAVGQKVILQASDKSVQGGGRISAILPVTETSTQTVIARVSLDDADGRWRPGMIVGADIVWAEREVPVAIPMAAIQTINDKPVVFVQDGKEFEIRQVLLGAINGDWAEVIEGLYEGETYVAANSFLMKADAGKESAEHEH